MSTKWYTPKAFSSDTGTIKFTQPGSVSTTDDKSTAWTSSSTVYLIELILYLGLTPLSIYLWRKHGRRNALGSLYMTLFCVVQIIAAIDMLLPANRNAKIPSLTAIIFSSVGLSPLLLMLAGYAHYIHETNLLYTQRQSRPAASIKRTKILLWLLQGQIHLISSIGMTLSMTGGIDLATDSATLTSSQISHAEKLRSIGSAIIALLWLGVAQYLLWLFIHTRRSNGAGEEQHTLAFWTLCASPFVGAKAVYTVFYSFDHSNLSLNPVLGALWVKIVFILCVPLTAVLCVCVGAFRTREFKSQRLYWSGYKAVEDGAQRLKGVEAVGR